MLILAIGVLPNEVSNMRFSHLHNQTHIYLRGDNITTGWSAVGGQTTSAYIEGGIRHDQGRGGPTVNIGLLHSTVDCNFMS